MAGGEPLGAPAKRSDLPVRTATALVMLVVAGTALWFGGIVWRLFVVGIGLGVLFEWRVLVILARPPGASRVLWMIGGLLYCGLAVFELLMLRDGGIAGVLLILLAVIATDVGAYFAGRTFGGPKIAPRISPSKTWSGYVGGALGAALVFWLMTPDRCFEGPANPIANWALCFRLTWNLPSNLYDLPVGAIFAAAAQAGDFFESWMKRRAGVKDSGRLLPGHGGLFDRVDGLLSVLVVMGIIFAIGQLA